ncbi:MAG TPA: DUF1259 domain-containing protein [Terriglobales bacterium]|nr:DUF1259 domain-containing protein [Terriglobales bacterium]
MKTADETTRHVNSFLIPTITLVVLLTLGSAQFLGQATNEKSDWKPVEDAMGRSGKLQPGDVFKFGMPRKDLQVTVNGVQVKPGLALGSWAAFKKMGEEAMVMGDLVLTTDEVEPVMLKLQQEGIEQTALHNHLLGESPRVMYMHIAGRGDAVKLARALHDALALTKTPAEGNPPSSPPKLDIDTAGIDEALGRKGKNDNGIYKIEVPRSEKITDSDMEVPPSMGVATAINFQPTGGGKAAITGDFVLIASEVNPVIRALRENGIAVNAVHNHMLNENPRLFFIHYWANADAVKLAHGIRAALDKTNSAKATGQ